MEGPSPVVVIDKDAFKESGTNTVNDLIRESPYFERSRDEGHRAGFFRFRGQHAGNTLVLLNGMRIPKMGAPGRNFFNGVKSIPTNVIERVEILKDGSSALYGSDAMAGVINFITKKNYDGAEFSMRGTVPEKGIGLEQNYTATFGKNFSKGHWFTTVQYVDQAGYTEEQLGSHYRGTFPSAKQSTFRIRSRRRTVWEKSPDCDGKRCDDDNDFSIDQVRTPKQNLSALITGQVDVSPDFKASILGMYNRRARSMGIRA